MEIQRASINLIVSQQTACFWMSAALGGMRNSSLFTVKGRGVVPDICFLHCEESRLYRPRGNQRPDSFQTSFPKKLKGKVQLQLNGQGHSSYKRVQFLQKSVTQAAKKRAPIQKGSAVSPFLGPSEWGPWECSGIGCHFSTEAVAMQRSQFREKGYEQSNNRLLKNH